MIPPIAIDPLDTCWGCGSTEVGNGDDGRVLVRYSGTEPLARIMIEGQKQLCATCRSDLTEEPDVDPMHLVRGSYWEAHVLESCWRCLTGPVDAKDDVGLCPRCRSQLGAI